MYIVDLLNNSAFGLVVDILTCRSVTDRCAEVHGVYGVLCKHHCYGVGAWLNSTCPVGQEIM